MASSRNTGSSNPWPLLVAGSFLGFGLGGFVDGILFHQILQWHHMLTAVDDPAVANDLTLNTLADGLFHAVTWLFTVTGVVLLWHAWRRPDVPPSGRILGGAVLIGAGLFNLVEGLIDHHLLAIHHVYPAGPGSVLLWDLAYLAVGAALVLLGWALARSDASFGAPGERAGTRRPT